MGGERERLQLSSRRRQRYDERDRHRSFENEERLYDRKGFPPLFFFSPCDSFFNQRRSGRDSEGNFENPGDVVGDVLFPFNFFFWKGNIFFFCDGFEER